MTMNTRNGLNILVGYTMLFLNLTSCNGKTSTEQVVQATQTQLIGEYSISITTPESKLSVTPSKTQHKLINKPTSTVSHSPTPISSSENAYPVAGAENPSAPVTTVLYPYPPPVNGNIQTTPTIQPTQPVSNPLTPEPEIVIFTKLSASNPYNVNLVSGGVQLIEFFAFWDPICKSMAPVLHKLEVQYKGKIKFSYLDIDDPENNKLKAELGFEYPPHIFLIDKDGNILHQWKGYVGEAELILAISSIQ